jgi:hypothetical protein
LSTAQCESRPLFDHFSEQAERGYKVGNKNVLHKKTTMPVVLKLRTATDFLQKTAKRHSQKKAS